MEVYRRIRKQLKSVDIAIIDEIGFQRFEW